MADERSFTVNVYKRDDGTEVSEIVFNDKKKKKKEKVEEALDTE